MCGRGVSFCGVFGRGEEGVSLGSCTGGRINRNVRGEGEGEGEGEER